MVERPPADHEDEHGGGGQLDRQGRRGVALHETGIGIIRAMWEFEDRFEGPELDERKWLPYYLPQWSSRERAAARYEVGGGLRLLIEEDQPPWCPEWDGELRVSSLQTGVFARPGRQPPRPAERLPRRRGRARGAARDAAVPPAVRPHRDAPARDRSPARDGRAVDDRLRGRAGALRRDLRRRDLRPRRPRPRPRAGRHGHPPFGDPALREEWAQEELAIDVREPHVYAADWTPEHVAFSVDGEHVKTVGQSPAYPMQLMLGVYEFPGEERRLPARLLRRLRQGVPPCLRSSPASR